MEAVSLDSPVQVPEYTDKTLNPREADYFKEISEQILLSKGCGSYYSRNSFLITKRDLTRSLRVLQYFDCIDGNMDFSKEQILKKLVNKLYFGGISWFSHGYSGKVAEALSEGEKYDRAEMTISVLFPEILN